MRKFYDERDLCELDLQGGYYSNHVNAMTNECLHSTSDIAAELAHRDVLIDDMRNSMRHILNYTRANNGRLQQENVKLRKLLADAVDILDNKSTTVVYDNHVLEVIELVETAKKLLKEGEQK